MSERRCGWAITVFVAGLTAGLGSSAEALATKCPSPPGFKAQRVQVPLDRSGAVAGRSAYAFNVGPPRVRVQAR